MRRRRRRRRRTRRRRRGRRADGRALVERCVLISPSLLSLLLSDTDTSSSPTARRQEAPEEQVIHSPSFPSFECWGSFLLFDMMRSAEKCAVGVVLFPSPRRCGAVVRSFLLYYQAPFSTSISLPSVESIREEREVKEAVHTQRSPLSVLCCTHRPAALVTSSASSFVRALFFPCSALLLFSRQNRVW